MVDPVTAKVAEKATDVAAKATDKVKDAAKEGVNGIAGFVKGLVLGIPNTIMGLGKGAIQGTIGSLSRVLLMAGGIFVGARFMPDLMIKLPGGEKLAEDARKGGGDGAIIKDALIVSAAGSAAISMLGNTVASPKGKSGAERSGSVISSTITVAGLAYLAYNAATGHKINFSGSDDHSSKTPGTTPAAPEAEKNKNIG